MLTMFVTLILATLISISNWNLSESGKTHTQHNFSDKKKQVSYHDSFVTLDLFVILSQHTDLL